jgi:transposase
MNVHKNARLTPRGRERIVRQVESGQTPEAVADAAGVCSRTVRKWVDRYRREGLAGLQDRSSRPHRLHRPTPQAVIEKIERLRRQRWTGKQIAVEVGVSSATVSRVLRRLGLNKLNALEPVEPVRRYEREYPGEVAYMRPHGSTSVAETLILPGGGGVTSGPPPLSLSATLLSCSSRNFFQASRACSASR